MTVREFESLLDNAASGDLPSMRGIAMLCYQMVDAGIKNGDIKTANEFMAVGDGWKDISESGFTDFGNELDNVKNLTREMFSSCF